MITNHNCAFTSGDLSAVRCSDHMVAMTWRKNTSEKSISVFDFMQRRQRRQPAALKLRMPLVTSSQPGCRRRRRCMKSTTSNDTIPSFRFQNKSRRGKKRYKKYIIGNILTGQIKSLAGHNWPAGRLLPTPVLQCTCL